MKHYTKCSIIFNNTIHAVNNVTIYLLDTEFSQYNLAIGLDILGLNITAQNYPSTNMNNMLFKQNWIRDIIRFKYKCTKTSID